MKRIIFLIFIAILLSGCAEMKVAADVIDILVPDKPKPVPVCDKDSVGTIHKGKICLKYSDNTYKWVDNNLKNKLQSASDEAVLETDKEVKP